MRKRFWKIEYSITIFVIFAIVLLLIPSKFMASKEATYISQWNETFTKMDYIFTAMNAQADADIIKSFKHAKSNEEREQLMMNLVKPYLRISEQDELTKKYNPYYLNGAKVKASDEFHFDNLYLTSKNKIVGIKDIKDIFGINIFVDGNITPIGSGWDLEDLKKDCSESGTGVSCSHYYRIGGDFNE